MCVRRAPEYSEACAGVLVLHVRVLAAIKPTQLNDPSGLSSVGLDLRNPKNLLFGGGVSSCRDKRRVRSLASLVHCRSKPPAKNENAPTPQGTPELF
jgi:hypothetical protein